jgi:Histidine kinase-like ATPase domain
MPAPPRPTLADLAPPGTGPARSTAADHASNGAASTASAHPAAAASSPAWHATLPGLSASVPAVRSLVRAALPGCPRADDLALAVTELAANAVTHSAARHTGTYTLTIRTAPRWARIEITDPGPALQPSPPGNGWGQPIIAAVTDRHGTCQGPGPARTTWAEVTWPAAHQP